MPVDSDVGFSPVGQESFHAVDKVLMRHVFDIHNALGRFFDERIYQEELVNRCDDNGIEALREVEIRVSHRDFAKVYYLDLLVHRGLIYELKAAERLVSVHQSQLINYLLLAGINHGKLVNFRAGSVESRFVSTRLTRKDRLNFNIDESSWHANSDKCRELKNVLVDLLRDWGAYLDVSLYREALLHFLGEPIPGIHAVNIEVNGRIVGSQKMCLLDQDTAWHLSAARVYLQSYETHISRLLLHTRIQRIHWININQRTITLKTLQK